MSRDGKEVDAQFVDLGQDLADRLRRIGVNHDAVVASDLGDFGDRLNRADLVVRMHNADEECPWLIASRRSSGSTRPRRRPKIGHGGAQTFEEAARFEWSPDVRSART